MKKLMRFLLVCIIAISILNLNGCESKERQVNKLLTKLVESDFVPDTEALNKLIQIGEPVIHPTLKRLKNTKDTRSQEIYLIVLHLIGDESISDAILPFTDSPEGNVREWCVYVLSKVGNNKSIGTLIHSLSDSAIEPQAKELAVSRLQLLTGVNIAFRENMTFEEKKAAVKTWQDWWFKQSKT